MRLRLGRIGQTHVFLQVGTLLFAGYMVLIGHGALFLAGSLSICLHEAAHACCAALLGFPPAEVELSPLGAVMRLEDEAALPRLRRLLIVLAGPACSLALCGLSVLLTRANGLAPSLGRLVFTCNAAIVLVNLLPALPLDGGRLLALILDALLPPKWSRRILRVTGVILGCVLIGCNLLISYTFGGMNLTLATAGCFLLYSAHASTTTMAMQEYRRLLDRKILLEKRGLLPCVWLAASERTPIRQVVSSLPERKYCMLLVLEDGVMRPLAQVNERTVVERYLESPGESCRVFQRDVEGSG